MLEFGHILSINSVSSLEIYLGTVWLAAKQLVAPGQALGNRAAIDVPSNHFFLFDRHLERFASLRRSKINTMLTTQLPSCHDNATNGSHEFRVKRKPCPNGRTLV